MVELNYSRDKVIEKERYDFLSEGKIKSFNTLSNQNSICFGSKAVQLIYRKPYEYYEEIISNVINPEFEILDLCCGDGIHTFPMAKSGARITAVDISATSIELCKIKAANYEINNINFQVADIEKLNFPDNTFDLVTMVGSLSYVDHSLFFNNLMRIIKPNGYFICIDSLNENPFYRFNRYIHYLKGNRTASTLARMPDMKTLNLFHKKFELINVQYFGIIMFLEKLFILLMGEVKAASLIYLFDKKVKFMKKYAFKFILIANGVKK